MAGSIALVMSSCLKRHLKPEAIGWEAGKPEGFGSAKMPSKNENLKKFL
jgi:hypothetical protein